MPQVDALPGMPDVLRRVPPKAREYEALTLDQAIDRAHAIVDRAYDSYPADYKLLLFSGGADSSILAHLMRDRVDMAVHVDTGISIPACGAYVRAACGEWGLPLRIAYPEDSYRDLVLGRVVTKTDRGKRPKGSPLWVGFPGPAGHHIMYVRLKERALDRLRTELVGPRGKAGQIVQLAGMRWGESDRRLRNAEEIDPDGARVWVSPLVWWTNGHMQEYRRRHMCWKDHEHAPHRLCFDGALPLSEVSEHLHMSGDCLCGAYARPGELAEIELFYPSVAKRIRELQDEARDAGVARCVWGAGKQPGDVDPEPAGRLCSSCVPPIPQDDLFEQWRAQGLIDEDAFVSLRVEEVAGDGMA